ncbi:uncharacterized protein LOC123009429 [Tribolium madens]|uniref:uncharacterized protein LOC123009429 n=1 Tax=Tribolium madens TaxID=41895 RepID=UPI001CF75BBD|nr:uncharacterized protein LOC123009429 [Tribolium madens]
MSFPLFFLILFLFKSATPSDLNVGTTLFTKADRAKECWSSENVALLSSRMILEDLLPSTSILVIDSNEFVTDLVEYFRLILEIVRKETHGKTKHITLLALTDLLGGYLHHAVLPISKYAYYAGLIDYDSMATLLGLFDELKWFLRTNGQGWAKPLPQNLENFEIRLIPLQSPIQHKDDCDNLMFVQGDQPQNTEKSGSGHCDATIPIPFFDSNTRPSAIALPTKSCPLQNVEANTSSYLVMKFFVTSYKCLQLKNAKTENIDKFQCDFVHWIDEQIMPRLADEKFYAAFGGILRVRNTLKRLGVSSGTAEKQIDDFRRVIEEAQKPTQNGGRQQMSRAAMILTAVLITIFVWFLLGTMFICYKMRQSKPCSPEGGSKTTTCSSLTSSKYFYPEKLSSSSTKRGGRQQIVITSCRCKDDNDEDEDEDYTTNSGTVNDSTRTDGKLTSITEKSEPSSKSTISPTPSLPSKANDENSKPKNLAKNDAPKRKGKVQRQVYMDSDSDSDSPGKT